MAKSKLSSLQKRIISALILLPLVIGALWLGYPYVHLLALVCGAMMVWEWKNMVPNKGNGLYVVTYMVAVAAAIFLSPSCLFLAVLAAASAFVWYKAKKEQWRKMLTFGAPYMAIGLGALVWLYDVVGFSVTFWFLIMVWCVDIGGYVVGVNVRGPKLAPKISPNKTWSGLLGGVSLAVAASFAYTFFVKECTYAYMLLAAVLAVIAQIGDLLESYIKRQLKIKDSSNLIPGHGGVFDRIDGVIFAAPFAWLWFKYGVILFN